MFKASMGNIVSSRSAAHVTLLVRERFGRDNIKNKLYGNINS
jgi:hypothetical protein